MNFFSEIQKIQFSKKKKYINKYQNCFLKKYIKMLKYQIPKNNFIPFRDWSWKVSKYFGT